MKWAKLSLVILLIGVICGLILREYRMSQVVGHANYRFNLAVIDPEKGVSFVSFDPAEKRILSIPFPANLAITSRSSGEYSIASLYKLGSYKGEGGRFARQKIQGFMRVPVPGYLVGRGGYKPLLFKAIFGNGETSLTGFDAFLLFVRSNNYKFREIKQDELIRAGVIQDNKYKSERLQEFVGNRLFDWGIGGNEITVAIINASGENGLGSDMADFLSNLGLDVVMVRSEPGEGVLEHSTWQIDNDKSRKELVYIFKNLFEMGEPITESIPTEYRADVIVKIGKDAKSLF